MKRPTAIIIAHPKKKPSQRLKPRIERSRVDNRWCVHNYKYEALCWGWQIPLVFIAALFSKEPV